MKISKRFETMAPYQPIVPFDVLSARLGRKPEDIVKLDANENPYGPSPRARQALANLTFANIYPDPDSRALRAALAKYTGAPEKNILAGAGADELIDLLLRVVLDPGDVVMSCSPTFAMYRFDTELNAGHFVDVPRQPDFSLDLKALKAAVEKEQPKVLILASPNNPDGSMLSREEMEAVLALPVLVVLDEAYIEFCGQGSLGQAASLAKEAAKRENLIVLRTFSKWAGLAGLRVGYGVFPDWILPALWTAKQPYNVNVAASAAAIASLEDLEERAEKVALLVQERQRLSSKLQELPFLQVYASNSNFILCRVKDLDASELRQSLEQQGILVRYYNSPQLEDCIRISVGQPDATDKIVAALVEHVKDPLSRDAIRGLWDAEQKTLGALSTGRTACLERKTGETQVFVNLNLDGQGKRKIATQLPFLDHMLNQIALHGCFDLEVQAVGDVAVDPHHTVEDIALVLGSAFSQALGERSGIQRCGWSLFPLDEALAEVVVDFSGRPYAVFKAQWNGPETGGIPNSLWQHFMESFAVRAGCNLHAVVRYGRDDHHQVEALFKALARALDMAVRFDPRRTGQVASTKGTVSL
jgi:histidinol-phosphate aminotransferase